MTPRRTLLPLMLTLACRSDTTALSADADGASSSGASQTSGASGDSGDPSSGGPSSSESSETASGTDTSNEASGGSSTDTAADTPPEALSDLYRTPMDTPLVVAAADGLFANDLRATGLTLAEADAESERGGTVIVDEGGGFTYTPPNGTWGPDSFGYTAIDAGGMTASTTATINVLPVQVPLSSIGIGGYPIDGLPGMQAGWEVAGAGDIDGDGVADIAIGSAYGIAGGGRVDVVFGKANHDAVALGDVGNGEGGFRIAGAQMNGLAGYSVDSAGDVNGDGLDDLVIADPGVFSWGDTSVPFSAYVVFGKADGAPVELAEVAGGAGGFVVTGVGQPLDSGPRLFVAGAGDVNGDGLADVALTIPSTVDTDLPRTWVVFGKASTEPVAVDDLAAQQGGFAIEGGGTIPPGRRPVDGAGDVNGDGAGDLVLGAPEASPQVPGRAYVVFGKADSATVDLPAVAAGVGGFAIVGEGPSDSVGNEVAGVGDVDGDGLSDVAIGALYFGNAADGRGYVVFGKANTEPVALAAVAQGDGGFAVLGQVDGFLGLSVGGGGDIDGDGLDDVVFGASTVLPNWTQGRVYVVYGKADGQAVDLAASMDGSEGYWLDGAATFHGIGDSATIAGDVDADGLADVLLSGSSDLDYAGRVFVFAGTSRAPG